MPNVKKLYNYIEQHTFEKIINAYIELQSKLSKSNKVNTKLQADQNKTNKVNLFFVLYFFVLHFLYLLFLPLV